LVKKAREKQREKGSNGQKQGKKSCPEEKKTPYSREREGVEAGEMFKIK